MKLRHLVPFMLLMAWQAAPAGQDSVPPRRFRLWLGVTMAQFEDATYGAGCMGGQGPLLKTENVEVRSVGARADLLTRGGLRLTAFAGDVTSSRGSAAGRFAGVQVASEGRRLGMGAGMTLGVPAAVATKVKGTFPALPRGLNLYLRAGNIAGLNVRADLLAPSEAFGLMGYLRLALGYNEEQDRGVGGLAGLSANPYGSTWFGEITVPTRSRLDVVLRGQIGSGEQSTPWGLGFGARYRF